jgi:hypothetical protein
MRWSSVLALLVLLLLAGTVSRPLPEAGTERECQPSRVVLGVNAKGAADVELVDRAGLRWVRFTIPWRQVNPERGVWRWEAVDALVAAHHGAEHRMLAILSTAPEWAGSNANGTRPPEDVALWQEFVGRTAQRYRGKIDAYEIWNEPDHREEGVGVGWAGPLFGHPAYADYLRDAALAIREHAPGTLVVAPAAGSDPRKETVRLFRSLEEHALPEGNASRFVDVVSVHANARNDEGSDVVWRRLRQHLRTLAGRNPSNLGKPVWITELGWPSDAVGEEGQRRNTEDLLTRLAAGWEDAGHPLPCGGGRGELVAFLYKEQDGGGESRGLYREDGTPKPIVTEVLQGLETPGVIGPPPSRPTPPAGLGPRRPLTSPRPREIRWPRKLLPPARAAARPCSWSSSPCCSRAPSP